ncbi:hypothetical protein E6C50_11860 [Flavobacterium supellecticarium]|uniref:Uncharacterized protein n=1 Tax=Flavobacterium supellecticarium TaxID=2565924 RepID=A0A4S3ZUL1_9FLAO|nr:hypothetical protein [Flavobacterium supellecticarium]THF49439.1 hypothetical protein E6C50_11860 [Flavobacterium supellecticarium]
MKTAIASIVHGIEQKHVNDPTVPDDLDRIVTMILSDLPQAIDAINNLDLNTLGWIASRFEAISYKAQHKEFVMCLEGLLVKFPNSTILRQDVLEGVAAYYGEIE